VARDAPKLGAWAVWVYHPLVTRALIEAAGRTDIAVIAWTVDSAARMQELAALGVDGVVTNDPRLFSQLGA
jgi:glycerophosphoryl diester phosphodiesterase